MKVLVLAAGMSNRMKPIGDKNFLEFLGKPLIEHQLEFLQRNGLTEIVVVGRDTNLEKIREVGARLGLELELCEQRDDKGMCGAVLAAKEYIAGGEVLIFCSNDVVEDKALELVMEADSDGCILGKKVESYFPGGYLEVADGLIKNIIEKPGAGNEPSDLVNLVVHRHCSADRLIGALEKVESGADDLYEVALTQLISEGARYKALEYDGFWQPIKYPWHVHAVFEYYFAQAEKGVAEGAQVAANAVINGEVIIEDGVKIFDGAVINGPVYIGRGSVVATNALLRQSHIGRDCMVGFATEVARSYWGDKVWTHMNYVGDSVVGNDVSFGAGAVTGNLRLDDGEVCGQAKLGAIVGNGVRVGINTSIMPGVRIGCGTFVGAGIVLAKDVEDGKFVRGSWELKISPNKYEK